ncbi:MAG: C13 family peptidase [Candidatus Hodarchaeota archaeon]
MTIQVHKRFIKKRTGQVVVHDHSKIISAIFRAQQSLGKGNEKLAVDYVLDHSSWALIVAGSAGESVVINDTLTWIKQYAFTYSDLRMYQTLKFDYEDFTDGNIYLLTPYDTVRGENVPQDAPTNKANFEWAINSIGEFADSDDQVLIFWTSHGQEEPFKLDVDSTWISVSEFDSNLDKINCSEMIIIVEACYSGALRESLDDESNRVMYFSSKANQTSKGWENDTHIGLIFSNATIRALDPDCNASDADTDNPPDNHVSMLEMFLFANASVIDLTEDQDPQRWFGTNDDDEIYLGDYQ